MSPFERLDRLWAEHGAADEWVFCAHMMRNGDLFLALSLLDQFLRQHGGGRPVRLLTATSAQSSVASLFAGLPCRARFVPDVDGIAVEDLLHWTHARGRDGFAPGNLLLLQPWSLAHRPLELNALVNAWQVSYVSLLAMTLRLPLSAAPSPPRRDPAGRREAARIATATGIPRGAGLVLFPYAQSFHADHLGALARLAARAREAGWRVVTSCVPGREEPIPGTDPVDLPFRAVRPFCEWAGHAVSVRSGISDMLAQGALRHAVLYDRAGLRDVWGLHAMGLGGTARELVLPPGEAVPDDAADAIWDALAAPESGPQPCYPPVDTLSLLRSAPLVVPEAEGRAVRRIGLDQPHARSRFLVSHAGVVLAEGWSVEPWGAWTVGRRAAFYLHLDEAGCGWLRGRPLRLVLRGAASVSEAHPRLRLTLRVGRALHHRTLRYLGPGEIAVPLDAAPGQPLLVEVLVANPQSPSLLSGGESRDTRPLGFGLKEVVVEAG